MRDNWPSLHLSEWKDTCETLHMWTQVVGKVRLARAPFVNHSWHVPLYVTPRGLTTSTIPHEEKSFAIEFDFTDHRLVIEDSGGEREALDLVPQTVAAFYRKLTRTLEEMGLGVKIWTRPVEVEQAIPFDEDEVHAAYDAAAVERFHRLLLSVDEVLQEFRGRFVGKCSPVHFFWGSFDMAVTRFSGRAAPEHPGGVPNLADRIVKEAYSQEVSSAGWWPGGGAHDSSAFYSYAYPEPAGFRDAVIRPQAAFYSESLREFVLPYEAVRTADDRKGTLMDFLETTYVAAAEKGNWDRGRLER